MLSISTFTSIPTFPSVHSKHICNKYSFLSSYNNISCDYNGKRCKRKVVFAFEGFHFPFLDKRLIPSHGPFSAYRIKALKLDTLPNYTGILFLCYDPYGY